MQCLNQKNHGMNYTAVILTCGMQGMVKDSSILPLGRTRKVPKVQLGLSVKREQSWAEESIETRASAKAL